MKIIYIIVSKKNLLRYNIVIFYQKIKNQNKIYKFNKKKSKK